MSAAPASPAHEVFADPYQHWRKNLLPIERVRALSTLRPGRVIFDTIRCWAVIVAAWAAVALWTEWWVVLLAIPVIGSRYYALFIIGHDGLHRRLFARRWLNDLYNDLFIIGPIGAITHINDRNHLNHHHYLATEHDPDRHKHGCFNKTRLSELFGYLTGITSVYRSVKHVFFNKQPAPDGAARQGHTLLDLAIMLTWQVLLIGGLTWAIGWWAFPVLWLVPVFALLVGLGMADVFSKIAVFFSKMAVVTFGGAYAALAYVAQQAVENYGWLKPGEMLDGLGMAETTPGPLIMVLQFVGFMAAYRAAGPLPPMLAGTLGGLLATWVTFTPCFLWIFLGAPFVESIRGNKALAGALSAITAAVVGVILNLAVWFAVHTVFREARPVRAYGLAFDAPVPSSVDTWALALSVAAIIVTFRLKVGMMPTLAGACAAGIALFGLGVLR